MSLQRFAAQSFDGLREAIESDHIDLNKNIRHFNILSQRPGVPAGRAQMGLGNIKKHIDCQFLYSIKDHAFLLLNKK